MHRQPHHHAHTWGIRMQGHRQPHHHTHAWGIRMQGHRQPRHHTHNRGIHTTYPLQPMDQGVWRMHSTHMRITIHPHPGHIIHILSLLSLKRVTHHRAWTPLTNKGDSCNRTPTTVQRVQSGGCEITLANNEYNVTTYATFVVQITPQSTTSTMGSIWLQ